MGVAFFGNWRYSLEVVQRSQGESNPDTELEQESQRILNGFREARILRPIARVKAWSRPPITGFDPVKAKKTYDAYQRARVAFENPPLFEIRMGEFKELLTDFLSA